LNRTQTSAIPFRLGFIDCFLMVPAATANRLVHGERGVVGGKAGLTIAAPPESRAAPDRELVDLCGSVTQSIVHHWVSPEIAALASMVRPTRWLVVTGIPISAVHSEMQSAEKEISVGLFCRQAAFCFLQGSRPVANAWAIAKVAGDGHRLGEYCRTLMRV
jgi:hypothetical protein